MPRCADPHCRCGIRYPVRCDWPDRWEFRSINSVRGLTRVIDGYIVRPSLRLDFDPSEIEDSGSRGAMCAFIRKVFGQDPALGITVAGSAKPIMRPEELERLEESRRQISCESELFMGGVMTGMALGIFVVLAAQYIWPV